MIDMKMGNQRSNGASVNGPTKGADEIVDGRLQGPAELHLREDYGRQHGPQREGNDQQVIEPGAALSTRRSLKSTIFNITWPLG